MEDWEQFFEEKSRRRADKDRRKTRIRQLLLLTIAIAALFVLACYEWAAA